MNDIYNLPEYDTTAETAVDLETLASIHMTLQQAKNSILRGENFDRFARFTVQQINRDLGIIEQLIFPY